MRLSSLLDALDGQLAPTGALPSDDPVIRGISYDSRRVSPGDLFVEFGQFAGRAGGAVSQYGLHPRQGLGDSLRRFEEHQSVTPIAQRLQ